MKGFPENCSLLVILLRNLAMSHVHRPSFSLVLCPQRDLTYHFWILQCLGGNAKIWEGGRDTKIVPSNEELSGISCHFQVSPGTGFM